MLVLYFKEKNSLNDKKLECDIAGAPQRRDGASKETFIKCPNVALKTFHVSCFCVLFRETSLGRNKNHFHSFLAQQKRFSGSRGKITNNKLPRKKSGRNLNPIGAVFSGRSDQINWNFLFDLSLPATIFSAYKSGETHWRIHLVMQLKLITVCAFDCRNYSC